MALQAVQTTPGIWRVINDDGCVQSFPDGQSSTIDAFPTLQLAQQALVREMEWFFYLSIKSILKNEPPPPRMLDALGVEPSKVMPDSMAGLCRACATLLSFATVERETGRPKYNWKAARGECMGVPCRACPRCHEHSRCHHRLNCEGLAKGRAEKIRIVINAFKTGPLRAGATGVRDLGGPQANQGGGAGMDPRTSADGPGWKRSSHGTNASVIPGHVDPIAKRGPNIPAATQRPAVRASR